MPSETFVSHILIHLPPKNFKMVNRYGFYSRHISDRLKETIDAFRKKIAVSRYSFYQRQMYKTFGMNPFYCPACKVKMIVWEFYHYRYPPLKKYYYYFINPTRLDILSQTFIYLFDKRRGKEADASFKIIKYISKYLKNMNLVSL